MNIENINDSIRAILDGYETAAKSAGDLDLVEDLQNLRDRLDQAPENDTPRLDENDDWGNGWGEDDEDEPFVPEGFDSLEAWEQFKAEQAEVLTEEEAAGVIAVVDAERGGDIEDHLNPVLHAVTHDWDEEIGEEVEVEVETERPNMVLAYALLDADELDAETVGQIVNHRESAQLFGLLSDKARLAVRNGSKDNEKFLYITFDEKDKAFAAGIERNLFTYRGVKLLPGIGEVAARMLNNNEREELGI